MDSLIVEATSGSDVLKWWGGPATNLLVSVFYISAWSTWVGDPDVGLGWIYKQKQWRQDTKIPIV
jgi:hypothetical protein